jgi:hypothetical protein
MHALIEPTSTLLPVASLPTMSRRRGRKIKKGIVTILIKLRG